MKIISFFIVMAVCLTAPVQIEEALGDQYGHTGSLIFWLESNKPKYHIGEPIFITVTLSNHTTVPLLVHNRFNPFHDIQWDIFQESFGGLPIKTIPPEPLGTQDFVRLAPGQEVAKQLPDLTEIVNAPMKVGRYALRLTYTNKEKQDDSKTETWTGATVTNLIWIEITTSEKI